jgi:hypothetical protein
MKILFTNHRLRDRGGSELFTAEVTAELSRRGHETAVFTTVGGPFAEGLRQAGLTVVENPAACPFTPDVIHGQHHLETMAALTAWPRTPALYFLHGYGPWEERPPVHPRLLRYAVPCPAFLPWLELCCAASGPAVHLIRNFFDPAKFPARRPTARLLGRALVYHNTMDPSGTIFRAIAEACATTGLHLETAGASFQRVLDDPGATLPEYDVVFASGRSAREAMACGCAVVPVTREQTGAWISPEEFDHALDQNFTLRPDGPTHTAPPAEVLRGIRPETLPALAARVRGTLTLSCAVDQLEALYQEILALPLPDDPAAEAAALASYLTSLAAYVKQSDADRAALLDKRDEAVRRATRWKEKAGQTRLQLDHIQTTLEKGNWWQRRLWRRLRRES